MLVLSVAVIVSVSNLRIIGETVEQYTNKMHSKYSILLYIGKYEAILGRAHLCKYYMNLVKSWGFHMVSWISCVGGGFGVWKREGNENAKEKNIY